VKRSILLLIVLILSGLMAPGTALAEQTFSPQALEIANSLNCPICEGQSVRDSNSQLARQMRDVIQEKVAAGESRQQIVDYFVERYGIGILRDPPKSGFILTLWWMPLIGLAVGALILGTFLVQRRARSAAASDALLNDEDSTSDPDLQRYEERFLQDLDRSDLRTP
jgi:cytochrome c-type biogenesis protein CcmH